MNLLNIQNDASGVARKCQRNWDYSRTVPQEHIEHLANIAKNAPTKQDEDYYNIAILTNLKMIDMVYKTTVGFTKLDKINGSVLKDDDGAVAWRNPQSRSNVLFLYFAKEPSTNHTYHFGLKDEKQNGKPIPNTDFNKKVQDTYAAMGSSIGITAFAAAQLGYVTGANKNFFNREQTKIDLGLEDMEGKIVYSLGIGYPDTTLRHYISHENKVYGSISHNRNRPVEIRYIN